MADIPSRGLSLKAFDDLNLVRLNNELKRIWTALETLNTAQPAPVEVSTEPESDQGYQFYETPPVVTPEPTDPVPDDPPERKDDPISMQNYSPTVTPHKSGHQVTISWDDWPGVSNEKVFGYKIYFSTEAVCSIIPANMQRRIVGNHTSIEIKKGLERGVSYDFRVQPFARGKTRKEDIDGVASD